MGAIAGVSTANLQPGRIIPYALLNGEAFQRFNVISNTACTSGQQLIVKINARERLNYYCGGSYRFCKPRLFSERLGSRLLPKRGGLQIRASHSGENTVPLQVDANGVATLQSLLDVSPSESSSSKQDYGRERLEALIERVRV